MPLPPDPVRPGDLPARFGRYELQRVLGQGGWGRVYAAELLGRAGFRKPCAIKVNADVTGRSGGGAMLLDEARLGARLHHPGVVEVYDLGEEEGRLFVAMELVDGCSLRELLRERGALPARAVVDLGAQVAAGLAHAHALRSGRASAGLVHQDVKPDNVLVDRAGRAKLADFGLARARGLTRARDAGIVEGTIGYAAPEQLAGSALDGRADLFALGVLLAEAALGAPPFPTTGAAPYAFALVDPIETLRGACVPDALRAACPGLDGVVARCLAARPEDRWESAEALRAALARLRPPPGPELAELVAERRGEAPAPRSADPEPTRALRRHNLRAETDAFFGRGAELERIHRELGAGRVVTLLGPGGVGKTRLALRAGARVVEQGSDEVWFCALAEARTPEELARAAAGALDLPLDPASRDPVGRVGDALGRRGPCLLLLDNAEQAVEALAGAVTRWRSAASEARFLVTSREALRVAGEVVIPVPPLPRPEAVALFRARGGDRHRPDAVERLVERLDRLPLALELGAAAASMLGVEGLLARLEGGPELLRARRRDRPARQAGIDALLGWSWALLEPWEQDALLQLSVFRGPFPVEAAEAVLDLHAHPGAPWALFVVEALLDKSLLRAEERPGEEPRFALFQLVRDWAGGRLEARGEEARAARRRHAAWFSRLGEREALAALDGPGALAATRRLHEAQPDLFAALQRALADPDPDRLPALGAAIAEAAAARGPTAPALLALDEALARPDLPEEGRLRLLHALGLLLVRGGDPGRLPEAATEARMLAERLGDREGKARALDHLATAAMLTGRTDEARVRSEEAMAEADAAGARSLLGRILGNRGVIEHIAGHADRFRAFTERALALHREVGDLRSEAVALGNLGAGCALEGDLEAAGRLLAESAEAHRRTGDRRAQALAELNLGLIAAPEGADDATLRAQRDRLLGTAAAFARLGVGGLEQVARGYAALARLRLGEAGADSELRRATARLAGEGLAHQRAMLLRDHAALLVETDPSGARALLAAAEEAAGPEGDKQLRAELAALLGLALVGQGEPAAARELLLRAEDLLFLSGAAGDSVAGGRVGALRARLAGDGPGEPGADR